MRPVPGLTLLAHPDPRLVGARVALVELVSGREVAISRNTPELCQVGGGRRSPLADSHVSRTPVHLRPGREPETLRLVRGGAPTEVLVDGSPLGRERELTRAELDRGVVLLFADRVALLVHRLSPVPELGPSIPELVGESEAMHALRRSITRAGTVDFSVLIQGETGTGKELVAGAIHRTGRRREGPFVALNMAAVPADLAAAELFGCVRGAFTGAETRPGYFERAHQGTLFLDEIGETPLDVQAALLRVLETGEVQPVGTARTQRVDVRVVAATDADVEQIVRAGRFRDSLWHRLTALTVHVPPLRERRDDVGRLFYDLLRRELATLGAEERLRPAAGSERPWVPAPLVARLAMHDWPGNVRQLRNLARALVVSFHDAPEIAPGPELDRALGDGHAAAGATPLEGGPRGSRPRTYRSAREVSPDELRAALQAHGGRICAAAAALGISRTALYTLIDRCEGVVKAGDLSLAQIDEALARAGGDVSAAAGLLTVSRHGLLLRLHNLRPRAR